MVEASKDEVFDMSALTQYERNLRWRARHRDKYNAYMREYMRKRRGGHDRDSERADGDSPAGGGGADGELAGSRARDVAGED